MTTPAYTATIRIPPELYEPALERAREEDRSLASLIRLALTEYLGITEPAA
jgi:hypothetical protein